MGRFEAAAADRLYQEAVRLSSQHLKPSAVFDYLVLFLHKHQLELPTYNTLADLITRALLAFEKRLLRRLQQHLHPGEQRLLDHLLAADDPNETDARETDAAGVTRSPFLSASARACAPGKSANGSPTSRPCGSSSSSCSRSGSACAFRTRPSPTTRSTCCGPRPRNFTAATSGAASTCSASWCTSTTSWVTPRSTRCCTR
ncbi:hypothetical protein [Hymenobacter sp. PAMC 26628]|uniref:hypothetical protein n=1 Tax=Hymenobacter sp. PAMC 26628 TaxID=1484118 RepID=UPI003FA60C83